MRLPELLPTEVARPEAKRSFSIQFYALALVLFTALPLMGAAVWNAFQAIGLTEEIATQELLQKAKAAAVDVERWVGSNQQVLEGIAARPTTKNLLCEASIAEVVKLRPGTDFLVLINASGEVICDYSDVKFSVLPPDQMLKLPLVQSLIQSKQPEAGSIQRSRLDDSWIVAFGHPVLSSDDDAVGYLLLTADLTEAANNIFDREPRSPTISVVDGKNNRLMRWPDPEQWIGSVVVPGPPGIQVDRNTSLFSGTNTRGREVIAVRTSVVGTSWRITATMPREEVVAAIRTKTDGLLIALGVMVAFITAATYLGARLISRPIQAVAKLAGAAADGQSLPDLSSSQAPSEILETARALVRMNLSIAASKERYRDLLNGTNAVVWEADAKTFRMLFVSDQVRSLLGYSPSEWLIEEFDWTKHIHPDDLVAAIKDAEAGVAQSGSWEQTYRVITLDNRIVWVRNLCTLIPDVGVIRGLTFDITKQVDIERALAANDARNRAIIDASPVPSALNDDAGNVVFLNKAFLTTFGYRPEDIPTLADWWPKAYPDDTYRQWVSDEWMKRLEIMERTGQPFQEMELEVRAKDGRALTIVASANPLVGYSKSLVLVTLIDITEREQSREKERLYKQIWEQSSDYFLVADTKGRVVDANQACTIALRRKYEELIGLDTKELFVAQVPDRERQEIRNRADRNGVAIADIHAKRSDGSTFHVSTTVTPLRNAQGQVTSRLVIARDQTAEDAQRSLLEKYSALITSAADPILTIDGAGIIRLCNPSAQAAFGYSEQELVGQHLDLLLPSGVHGRHQGWVETFFASTNNSRSMARLRTIQGRRKDGSILLLQISLSKSIDANGASAMAVIRDVTALQALQERLSQSEKISALGQLTGGIAHDVNNDLAVILGAAELIQEKSDPGSRLEVLSKRIIGTVQRSASLVQRMLAFSRKSAVEPANMELSKVVGELIETMRRTLGGRIDLRYVPPPSPAWVHVDRSMLESSLINLAVNARDAMPDGGTLTFGVTTEHREIRDGVSDWVVLSATDTGIGMSEDVRKRVFEPFFTTKPMGGGTGLGLATVYGFVQQSGGDIEVQSEVGKGSTFTIRLPQVTQLQSQQAGENAGATEGVGTGRTVLIVEDNEMLRTTLKEQLQDIGCQVLEAGTVEEAKAVITPHHVSVDYILSDLDLGAGPSGVDLAEWVKQQGYPIKGAIISGYLSAPIDRITATGWNRLQKPVQIKEVSRLISESQ